MSARLIKIAAQASLPAFAPFVLQNDAATRAPTGTVAPFAPQVARGIARPISISQAPPDKLNQQAGMALEIDSPSGLSLQDAHAEAEQIIAQARTEASEIERAARERGLRDARENVRAEVAQLAEPLRCQLQQTIEELATLRSVIAERGERDLVKLAIEIAKKIVHREVTTDSEIALALARVTLGRLHNRAEAKVHLHPEDFAYVSRHADRLANGSAIELVEDRAVGRGGCLVETEMGDTDARIEQQFAEIERSFLGT